MPKPLKQQLVLVAIGCLLLFTRLGAAHVWDMDEAVFSQTAAEMSNRGDWVVPYFNGELFPEKPAFMYWLMISACKVFGPTEFAARFWSAAFSIGTLLLTYHIGRRLFNAAVGFWGSIVLATSLNFAVIARAATPDAFLVFFCTLAMWFFVAGTVQRPAGEDAEEEPSGEDQRAHDRAPALAFRTPTFWTWLAAYLSMGFAVLDKGPVGVVLPTAVLGLFLLIINRRSSQVIVRRAAEPPLGAQIGCLGQGAACPSDHVGAAIMPRSFATRAKTARGWLRSTFAPTNFFGTIWKMRPLTALAAVLLVAGPWYAWVSIETHGAWLQSFLGVHNVGRFLHPMEHHQGPIFYYIPALVFGFFPWSLFLMLGLVQLVVRLGADCPRRTGYTFLLSWAAVWIGFFSLASTKLPNYIVPAYPALALATASLLCGWVTDPATISRVWLRIGWSLLALSGVGMLFVGPILANVFLAGDLFVGLIGIVPLAGAAACMIFSERSQPARAVVALTVTAVAFLVGLAAFVVPRVDRHQNSAQLAEVISQNKPDGDVHIGSFGYFRASLVYYAHQPIEKLASREQVAQFFGSQPGGAFLITTDDQYQQIVAALPRDVTILESSPRFLHSGKVLLLGRPGHDSPVVWPGATGPLEAAGKHGGTTR